MDKPRHNGTNKDARKGTNKAEKRPAKTSTRPAGLPRIIQVGEPVLRELAQTVKADDIGTPRIKAIINNLKEVLSYEQDGAAIAAPQIGIPLRIFVVSGKILNMIDTHNDPEKDLVFINPTITRLSKQKTECEEGCLSVRWLYGKIMRSEKVTLKAFDETGRKIERGASGLLAQIFQHETDHLNGVLFIDSAYDVIDVPPEEVENRLAE